MDSSGGWDMSDLGYPTRRLSEVLAVIESGSRPQGGVTETEHGIPSLGGENIRRDGELAIDNVRRVPLEFYKAMPRGHLRSLDVLINKDGAQTGKVGIYKGQFERACINEHVFLLRGITGEADQRFLYWSLVSGIAQRQIAKVITGSAQPGIGQGFAHHVTLRLPRVPAQIDIVEILDTADAVIRQTEATIAKLEQIKQGLLHDLLTRGIDENGELRDPVRHPEQFKDSPPGRIPLGWCVRRLVDVAKFQNGKAFPSTAYKDDGIRLLRPGNLPSSEFVTWEAGNTTCLDESWTSSALDYLVGGDELVMNLTAQSLEDQFLGRVCMTRPGERCLLNQRLARFRSVDCQLSFLFWSLRGPLFRAQMDRNPKGTKVQHIYNRDLEAVVLPIPKRKDEQEEIASVLFSTAQAVEIEYSQLSKLQNLRSGFMDDLLTGRVRI